MNLEFHGPAKACWILGLLMIMASAINSVVTGGNGLFPVLMLGLVSVGCAFFIRSRMRRG